MKQKILNGEFIAVRNSLTHWTAKLNGKNIDLHGKKLFPKILHFII